MERYGWKIHSMNKRMYTYRWDQSTYWGRARQFFTTTNTMNLFVTSAQLDQAKVNAFSPGGVFFSQGGYFFRGVSFPLTHNEL